MKVPTLGRAEIEQALLSPCTVFDTPEEILETPALTRLLKIELLIRWGLEACAEASTLDSALARLVSESETSFDL